MKGITLWLGMYLVTLGLFTYETGDPLKGAIFGIVAATLKTLWSLLHARLWRSRQAKTLTEKPAFYLTARNISS